jgi:hypothetical protein
VQPSPAGDFLSRRRSINELAIAEGEVVLAICILVESLDIDSKQVTFIAAHRHLATEGIFKALFKVDLTQPKSGAMSGPALQSAALLVAPSPSPHHRTLHGNAHN